jgi:hypothetical protein
VTGQSSPGSFNNVFLDNVSTGSVTLVSHLPNETTVSGAYDSNSPAISYNGEFVAFVSNGGVYLYDAKAPQSLTLINANGSSPSISDDGSLVAYVSQGNAFLFNRVTGASTLISHVASSTQAMLLALTAPPAVLTAGTPFTVTATVQDAFGHTDQAFNGSIRLELATGSPAGAVLGGMLSVPAVNGVAQFKNLTLTLAGIGYALTATSTGITSAVTPAFQVVPAAATQLLYLPPPALSLMNQPIAPSVAVATADTYGNVVNTAVSIRVGLGTHPTGAVLTGQATVTAMNGIASFSGLLLSLAGTYTLSAQATGFPVAFSPTFEVTAQSAGLVIHTVAGNGSSGNSGDGGLATAAELNAVESVAIDLKGDIYIADTYNERIQKVSPDGTLRPWPEPGPPVSAGITDRRRPPRSIWSLSVGWRWTPRAISTSRTRAMIAFAWLRRRELSPPWLVMGLRAMVATEGLLPQPSFLNQ